MLKVGAGVAGAEENRKGLAAIMLASFVSAGYFILAKMRLAAETAAQAFRVGGGATQSPAVVDGVHRRRPFVGIAVASR